MFTKRLLMCALLGLGVPLVAPAQQTVFNDTFVKGSTVGSNSVPGGTPTASSTIYDIDTHKGVTSLAGIGCVITNGQFNLAMIGTSSAYIEGSAIFTIHPVTLAIPGDTIDIQNVFTATTNYFSVSGFGGSATLALGLFNSGGSAPDTNMFNNGLVSTTITEAVGHAQNWLGYRCNLAYGAGTAAANSATMSRPAQNQGNNLNQSVINGFTGNVNLGQNSQNIAPLNIGSQYTEEFKITLQGNGSLAMTNTLYAGVGTGGTVLATNNASATGANILTTNFDALCVGGNRTGNTSNPTTNYINQIIITFTSSNQAGPYFSVISSGDPCAGGVDITLSGSVTTNAYFLYTNGVNSGVSLLGTGTVLDFGNQTVPANYTIIASNTVTASMGPMYGSANVFAPGVTIGAQPVPVTVVSNLPASFSVSAIGAALTYQWYKNGVPLTNNANISGAQSATLNIAAVGSGDAATSLSGYTVIAATPCGTSATSAPPVSLTLTQPRNLIWAGNNPFSAWDYTTDQEFTLGGLPASFTAGDNATFDDSSGYTTVTISNNVTSTMISVVGTQNYTFAGPNKLTGVSALAVGGSATLTIVNNGNNFTGGTVVSNGATLSIGNGSGINGNLTGTVTVAPTGTLDYSSGASAINTTINMLNGFSGSGTINVNDAAGATYATAPSAVINSNFNGTINIQGFTALHASSGNAGYALGNGSTVNAPDNTQIWLDPSATAYNDTFNIGGTGWQGATPQTGAMRIFNCTVTGSVNLMDNARIGGTINGATIQSVISGPYQMEVWGNTNSFVLILGPTNGLPQAYASTLITAGSIQAANTNAISTGPLTLDSGGDLRLFGNNLSVSNLSSVNSGHIVFAEGPRVRNMNTTNAATLTVGTDGTSTEFDGTFSDGAAASLGLTKIGAGILTLTLLNSNTGPVTVNGGSLLLNGIASFGKSALITVGSGATFDVSGRSDGTLTLSNAQILAGIGSVNGNLVAASGSTVAPGLPLGTLTVSGTATINSGAIYKPSLNRNNTPNYSTLSTISVNSGAILGVTNTGPALQIGDTFQVLAGATPNFTSFALQTNDTVNNVTYVWNNTGASDGKITVGGVLSRVPALQTLPAASAIIYGRAVSNSVISGGSVTNAVGTVVAGTFVFTTPTNAPGAGTSGQSVTFKPTDTNGYNPITLTINVTVNPQTPLLKTAPTASNITNGQALSLSVLSGGAVTNAAGSNVVGTFTFTAPSTVPGVGTAAQSVTFTATDTVDYTPFTFNVNVTVVAPAAVTALKFTSSPVVSGTNLTISATNTGAGTFYLLGGTNLTTTRKSWTPLWTNVAIGRSCFSRGVSIAVTPLSPARFYILSTTNNH